jgi:hypothetical protein
VQEAGRYGGPRTIRQDAGWGHGKESSRQLSSDVFRDRNWLASQLELAGIERLRHQRTLAKEEYVPVHIGSTQCRY